MQRLYDYNMNPIGYVSATVNGKTTVYDTNYRIRGDYFTESDKTYDNNMRLIGKGNQLTALCKP